jgi:peroxiredoxin
LQEILPEIEAAGATLVALSPQLAEFNVKMVDSHKLGFDILSDPKNAYAAELGLRFELPTEIAGIYSSFGIDLFGNNGDDSGTLPMPGRIVISADGLVRATDVDPDYTARPEPADTVAVLKQLKN